MSHQENNNSSFGISTQVEDVERKFKGSLATPLEPLLIIVSFIEAISSYARYYLGLWVKITISIFLVVAFVAFVFDKPAVF